MTVSSTRIFLLSLTLLMLVSCKEQIVHDLSEVEANKISLRLHEHLIHSEKIRQADGSWAISVTSDQALQAIKVLDDSRHFRRASVQEQSSGSVISSREDQRFQFERNLSREIENTLRSIESVYDARVHLNLPAVDPLFGRPLRGAERGTASVLLVVSNTQDVSRQDIAALVSGASGVAIKDVSVLLHQSVDTDRGDNALVLAIDQPEEIFSSKLERAGLMDKLSSKNILSASALFLIIAGIILLKRAIRTEQIQPSSTLSSIQR